MSEPFRRPTKRPDPSDLVVAAIAVVAVVFVIALGFDFEVGETIEVLAVGLLVTGVLGIFAGLAWAVGLVLDVLEDDDPG